VPFQQFIVADAVTGFFGGTQLKTDGAARSKRHRCRAFEEGAGLFTGLKQLFDALAQGRVTDAGFIEIGCSLPGRQPPGSAKDGHFAIRRICHVQTALLSALQCENPVQMAQKSIGCPGSIGDTNKESRSGSSPRPT
jgi:hypothetical protein